MTKSIRAGTALIATLILLLPALWNRFPLLEYDTGGYLARWFEGYLVPSRSTVYGFFLTAGWPLDFWPVVALQAAAAVWILLLVLRTHQLDARPVGFLLTIVLLAVATALPWIASLLLTDIFAGLGVLALHLVVFRSDQLERWERPALIVFIAFAGATHSATLAVLLALSVAALIVSLIDRHFVSRVAVARAVGAVLLGAAMLLAANFVLTKRLAWTPGGYGILFGRMLQDGIITRYLNEHCPDPRLRLCPYRAEIPQDADTFLWGDSVFDKLGRFDGLGDEMRIIVLESLYDYPWMQLKAAIEATFEQLVSVKTGEGELTTIWHTYGMIEKYTPSVAPAMQAARQQHGELHFRILNAIHVPIALAGMALLPFVVLLGWRRRGDFADLGLLATTAALALLGNAAVCGTISNPHDRYGSRIVWIAPFVIAVTAWRLWAQRTAARPASASRIDRNIASARRCDRRARHPDARGDRVPDRGRLGGSAGGSNSQRQARRPIGRRIIQHLRAGRERTRILLADQLREDGAVVARAALATALREDCGRVAPQRLRDGVTDVGAGQAHIGERALVETGEHRDVVAVPPGRGQPFGKRPDQCSGRGDHQRQRREGGGRTMDNHCHGKTSQCSRTGRPKVASDHVRSHPVCPPDFCDWPTVAEGH